MRLYDIPITKQVLYPLYALIVLRLYNSIYILIPTQNLKRS